MTATPDNAAPDPQQQIIAELQRKLDESRAELTARNSAYSERIAYQAAANDVLKVMSASPGDPQPVFDLIVERARDLCGGYGATVLEFDGTLIHWRAATGVSDNPSARQAVEAMYPMGPTREWPSGRAIIDRQIIHIMDLETEPGLTPAMRGLTVKSLVLVPFMRGGLPIGGLSLGSRERGGFTDSQIELLKTFAEQAVIAIENARLFNETKEGLERQAATADILTVIASSPSDVQPVFDAIASSANRLIGGLSTAVYSIIDDMQHLSAFTPINPVADAAFQALYPRPLTMQPWPEQTRNGEIVHVPDIEADAAVPEKWRDVWRMRGFRGFVRVPLRRDRVTVGMISVTRTEPGPFAAYHIQLLKTFADQAVIAIENARLFDEVRAKTRDLTEALTHQTGSANILRVIASSPTDVGPVLQAIVESACELCEATDAIVCLRDSDSIVYNAHHGPIPAVLERHVISRSFVAGRAVADRAPIHVHDMLSEEGDEFPGAKEWSAISGARSHLSVPLMREGESIGAILLRRREVQPFTDKQITLLQTFADQAVIALGNVRLFDEVQAKTRDLEAALEQESAGSEVLKLITMSSGELELVFQKLLESATRLCGAEFGIMNLLSGGMVRQVSFYNMPEAYVSEWRGKPYPPHPESVMGTVIRTRQAVHVDDVRTRPAYSAGNPAVVALSDIAGARTYVGVPMLQRDELVGMISIYRREVRPFDEKQVQLVERFASQAVIALENARLLNELRERTHQLSRSLENLRTTQDRLIQTEKLASLGQLTAGIAHEIKNPLNFVNNFSALSAELVGEMNDVLAGATLDKKTRGELDELAQTLKSNLEKVVQHGKRADSIVKNMLLHSREGSGEHRPADINSLLDESLNLAYHGSRAEKAGFTITLERKFDPSVGMVDVYPQEITRALLNLISNGFYATTKRKAEAGDGFEPTLSATTKHLGDSVEIRIRDNGTGIPEGVKDKIFNPFFTTKPTGEGTGLGLSMSHDIIVKQHGGSIDVETEPGRFTEFKIVLPRTNQR